LCIIASATSLDNKDSIIPSHLTLAHRIFHQPIQQQESTRPARSHAHPREQRIKSVFISAALLVVLLTSNVISAASELPDAPSTTAAIKSPTAPTTLVQPPTPAKSPLLDKKFLSLAIISTGSAFADSYTTLFARQNWLAGKTGVCNMETESAYLYGTHPTVARTYAVASVKSAGAIAAAFYLRKRHSKLWSLPLAANAIISLQGVTQNMINCN
jgi:hypothetical protein